MRNFWPMTQDELDTPELMVNREELVDRFNNVVGMLGREEKAFQESFIVGKVSYDEAVSYVRFCQHMIAAGANQARKAQR